MIEQIYELYIKSGNKISTDTRNIQPGSVFFALKGANFNGNKYAAEAVNKGAICAIIDEQEFESENTILVEDVLESLQKLANLYRKKTNIKVLALTGTNGKTTTKELIGSVLEKQYICHTTSGNLNNHIGVPLTILSAPLNTEIMVVEMGANHIGEIDFLCKIAEPDFGLITNIGKAHIEGFGSFEGVIKAKSELYKYLKENKKPIFLNSNDALLINLTDTYNNSIPYGKEADGCYVKNYNFDNGLATTIITNNTEIKLSTKLFGDYNLSNLLTAVKIGLYFNIKKESIISAINNYTPKNNRSQLYKSKNNTVILDCYNANPSSMHAAINSLNSVDDKNKTMLILGEMKELGNSSKEEHKKLLKLIKSKKIASCLLVGKAFKSLDLTTGKYFDDTKALVSYLKTNPINGYTILVKGSRANKLETLKDLL